MLSVLSDGNCLFRCVANFLNEDLRLANRSINGRINNRTLRDKETNFARFLRFSIVNVIEHQKNRYIDEIYYDSEHYSNIDNRIENMYNNGEFTGRLEMLVLSRMYKIKFNIYMHTPNDTNDTNDTNDYNLVNTIGFKSHRDCYLLLDQTHYSLITEPFDTITNNSASFKNTLGLGAANAGKYMGTSDAPYFIKSKYTTAACHRRSGNPTKCFPLIKVS